VSKLAKKNVIQNTPGVIDVGYGFDKTTRTAAAFLNHSIYFTVNGRLKLRAMPKIEGRLAGFRATQDRVFLFPIAAILLVRLRRQGSPLSDARNQRLRQRH